MSFSHAPWVWFHRESGGASPTGGWRMFRSMVAAVAAMPQRDGASQASCSSTGLAVQRDQRAAEHDLDERRQHQQRHRLLRRVLTTAEMSRPIVIEVKDSTATAMISSRQRRRDRARAPACSRPAMPMSDQQRRLHAGDQARARAPWTSGRPGPGQARRAFSLVDDPFLDQLADRVGGAGRRQAPTHEDQQHRGGGAVLVPAVPAMPCRPARRGMTARRSRPAGCTGTARKLRADADDRARSGGTSVLSCDSQLCGFGGGGEVGRARPAATPAVDVRRTYFWYCGDCQEPAAPSRGRGRSRRPRRRRPSRA